MARQKKKSFTITEIAAIVSMVTLTGFLGFTYVNNQQKLASTSNDSAKTVGNANQQSAISASDIKPITTSADLSTAHAQLDSIERELNSTGNSATLTQDLDAIIN